MASLLEENERFCEQCSTPLIRKTWSTGMLEPLGRFGRRRFCDHSCAIEYRSSKPSAALTKNGQRYQARKLIPKGSCARCDKPDARDVHHRDGNTANNNPANLERLCRSCHGQYHNAQHKRLCIICGGKHKGYGYCHVHLRRFKKYGDPLIVKRPKSGELLVITESVRSPDHVKPIRLCLMADCDRVGNMRGMCDMHYQRWRRTGDATQPHGRWGVIQRQTPGIGAGGTGESQGTDPGIVLAGGS